MLTLPTEIMLVLTPFMQVFSRRIWDWAQVLVVGAVLAPGKRTVTAILQVMGLKDERQYQNYHRVLNRASWSALAVSQVLLGLLVGAFLTEAEPLILGADDTLERRWGGGRIRARSIFRDSQRSSRHYPHFAPGLRWLSVMALVPLPWCRRRWALPFLTLLAPSPQTNAAHGCRHKTLVDWLIGSAAVVRRWQPKRRIIIVSDGSLSGVKLGWGYRRYHVTLVSRLNWRAVLHDRPGPRPKGKRGPQATKGARLPKLADYLADPQTLWTGCHLSWYGRQQQAVDLASGTALWYTPGQLPLPIRWVLVRDPVGKQKPAAFMTTDLALSPQQIVTY